MSTITSVVLRLTDSHISVVTKECSWFGVKAWVNWWTRPYDLNMLCKCQSDMTSSTWKACPSTTNAVYRATQFGIKVTTCSLHNACMPRYMFTRWTRQPSWSTWQQKPVYLTVTGINDLSRPLHAGTLLGDNKSGRRIKINH